MASHTLRRLSRTTFRVGAAGAAFGSQRIHTQSAAAEWGYVTDVEGNLDYWRSYVQISRVLSRQSDGTSLGAGPIGAHALTHI